MPELNLQLLNINSPANSAILNWIDKKWSDKRKLPFKSIMELTIKWIDNGQPFLQIDCFKARRTTLLACLGNSPKTLSQLIKSSKYKLAVVSAVLDLMAKDNEVIIDGYGNEIRYLPIDFIDNHQSTGVNRLNVLNFWNDLDNVEKKDLTDEILKECSCSKELVGKALRKLKANEAFFGEKLINIIQYLESKANEHNN